MNSVTLSRHLHADPDEVSRLVRDVGPFMRAADFDEVQVDGDEIRIANRVGIARMELTLDVVADPDAILAYEQRDGVFRSMRTVYDVAAEDGGARITATTEFAVDVSLVGDLLDATIIERQRRKELRSQFDWLAAQVE